MLTEKMLQKNLTRYINHPVDLYITSLVTNLHTRPITYSECKDLSKVHCVRIKSKALGFECNDHIYFNITRFEKIYKTTKHYFASLLVSVFAHESAHQDIIDYNFIPPIKEVQDSLNKYYSKEEHNDETLPNYFSLALLGCKNSASEICNRGKSLLLNQYFILRDSIVQEVKC